MKNCPVYIRRGTLQRVRAGKIYNQSGARKYLADRNDNHAASVVIPDKTLPVGSYIVRVEDGYEFYDPAAFKLYFRTPLLNILGHKFNRLPLLTKVAVFLLTSYAVVATFWWTALYLIIHNAGQ